jgi:hypothetical protein
MPEADAETIRKAVHETLLALGLDVGDPTELQQDFAFLRSWRESTRAVRRHTTLTAIGVVVTGGIALLVMAVKSVFGGGQ